MRTRIVFILAVLALGAVAANAQTTSTIDAPIIVPVRQYAAKFVCGKAGPHEISLFNAAPGSYFTIINVHNPALTGGVEFRKKFALANPQERAGRVSPFYPVALKADEALQIDCGSIYSHLGIAPGTFIDGFAVIQMLNTRPELDVVGVYTAAPPGGGVSTLHMERVAGRITP